MFNSVIFYDCHLFIFYCEAPWSFFMLYYGAINKNELDLQIQLHDLNITATSVTF